MVKHLKYPVIKCITTFSSNVKNKFPRYHKMDVTKPMEMNLHLYKFEDFLKNGLKNIISSNLVSEDKLDSCKFKRWFMDPKGNVERLVFEKDGLLGTLFTPPGKGPHPGVVVMFGGYPGLLEFKASLLAANGFAALALAFMGPGVPIFSMDEEKPNADFSYFKKAVDFMISHPRVMSSGVGLISISFSVHIALLMATHLEHIRCVICINGFIMNLSVEYTYKNTSFKPIDPDFFKKWGENAYKFVNKEFSPYELYPKLSLEELNNFEGKGMIPYFKRRNIAYMMIAGVDDHCLAADHFADLFRIQLEDSSHPNFTVLKYPGAGHLIEPPYGPNNAKTKFSGSIMDWGGDAISHAVAQEDSWSKQMEFLFTNLKTVNKL